MKTFVLHFQRSEVATEMKKPGLDVEGVRIHCSFEVDWKCGNYDLQ